MNATWTCSTSIAAVWDIGLVASIQPHAQHSYLVLWRQIQITVNKSVACSLCLSSLLRSNAVNDTKSLVRYIMTSTQKTRGKGGFEHYHYLQTSVFLWRRTITWDCIYALMEAGLSCCHVHVYICKLYWKLCGHVGGLVWLMRSGGCLRLCCVGLLSRHGHVLCCVAPTVPHNLYAIHLISTGWAEYGTCYFSEYKILGWLVLSRFF